METDWQCNLSTIKDRFSQVLERNCFTDVSFAVGRELKTVRSHKLVLSAASSVFAEMFYDTNNAFNDQEIVINGIQSDVFIQMLNYIYAEKIDIVSCENAIELYSVAKKYALNELGKACVNYFLNEIKSQKALRQYKQAKLFKEKAVEEKVLQLIKEHTVSVLNSVDYANISISDLMIVFEQNELQTTEYELFQALNSLALSKGDNIIATEMEAFRFAVKKIHFNFMTLEQFINLPNMSNLLLPEEKSAICACLHKPSLFQELYPKDFVRDLRKNKELPHVFFDIKIDGLSIGRIVVQLRADIVPKTVEEILGADFKNCLLDPCSKFFKVEGGSQFTFKESENYILKNKEPGGVGVLYCTENEKQSRCDSFFITFKKDVDFPNNVYIGTVVKGMDVVESIQSCGTESTQPSKKILIENYGKLNFFKPGHKA